MSRSRAVAMARALALVAAMLSLSLAAARPAHAAPYAVAGKFAFEPPQGWTEVAPVAFSDAIKKNLKLLPEAAQKLAASSDVPLAVFLGPDNGMFRNNLNIREVKGSPTIDAKAAEEYRKNALRAFGPALKPSIDKVEVIEVGGKKALRAELTYSLMSQTLKGVQAVYAGRDHTYISTYTVPVASFAAEQPAIDASVLSFRVTEPWYGWLTSRPILLYALIGIIGGGIIALVFRKRKTA